MRHPRRGSLRPTLAIALLVGVLGGRDATYLHLALAVGSHRRTGAWTVKVGLFTPGWGELLAWRNAAARFRIVR